MTKDSTLKQQRPVYLNLLKIRLPIPGLVSILHRMSGILLFLVIPFVLWLLHCSLYSYSSFNQLSIGLQTPVCKWSLFVIVAAFVYHLTAGLRHMIMDCGWGESLFAGRLSAMVVLVINVLFVILLGIRLW